MRQSALAAVGLDSFEQELLELILAAFEALDAACPRAVQAGEAPGGELIAPRDEAGRALRREGHGAALWRTDGETFHQTAL